MSNEPLQSYNAEVHDIYLGKNRRFTDPVFFPAPGRMDPLMKVAQEKITHEMESEPDGPRVTTREFMSQWGWGNYIRYPPGGPNPNLEDYEKAMNAMATEVRETWGKIQVLVKRNEDEIREWFSDAYSEMEQDDSRTNNPLYAAIIWSWQQTVTAFNGCHQDIKMFMEPKHTESDFQIGVPEFTLSRRFPFRFLSQNFFKGHPIIERPYRNHYAVAYHHPYNFYDPRAVKDWPHKGEPDMVGYDDPSFVCNQQDSREFYKRNRVSFLVPHIASYELLNLDRMLSFIHYRGRHHPSVFAKIDNDMTFIGRRTNYLTGPLIPNRMVSFEISGTGPVKSYRPKLWKGWAGRPDPETTTEMREEYDDLWHRGQLFGASEAWIMLQSQRATYHYLWNLLTFINPEACLTPNPREEQLRVLSNARAKMEALKKRNLNNWLAFTRLQPFLPPPTKIYPRYYRDLESKMEVAEKHIQDLFGDPEYFFGCIYTFKEHHWGNIEIESDETSNRCSVYVEQYADEQTRHMLYFDLIRGVLRRSVFEFYMWHSIHSRLQEFESMMHGTFADYGKEDDSEHDRDSDGTDMLQQPPLLLSNKKMHEHKVLAEKYLSLVALLRYHAIFFVNEFRKKGIHAGACTLSDLACIPQEETQDRICNIQKKHYGAPDLKYRSNFKDQLDGTHELSEHDKIRMFFFDLIDNFIFNPLASTNCGIKEAAGYLQEVTQNSEPEGKGVVFTHLLSDTIDGLDLLSSLADHLEYLWPAMERIGGAAADEAVRRKYFDLGGKDISINFLDFDDFDFDEKVPMKRLKRLFLFFDELQAFKEESISMGHAKGDLKRFGASLLSKLILPLNNKSKDHKANQEAIERLERAMGVSGSDYIFHAKEKPFNLDQKEAGEGAKVEVVNQTEFYRHFATRDRDMAKARQQQIDALVEEFRGSSVLDEAAKKKRRKKQARRRKKARTRAKASTEPESEAEKDGKDEDKAMPNAEKENTPDECIYAPRWEESLHATLRQSQLPPVPDTRILVEPQVAAPSSSASSQPAPQASDGRPKSIIKKREWATLEAIYGAHGRDNAAVSYAQIKAAMGALGYEEVGRGGSHMNYTRQDGRWPCDALPGCENIQLAKTHGGERAAASKGKSLDWGKRLSERGLTFEFIDQWYVER